MNRKEGIRIHINHALTIHIQYPIQPNQAEISNIQSKIKIKNNQKNQLEFQVPITIAIIIFHLMDWASPTPSEKTEAKGVYI